MTCFRTALCFSCVVSTLGCAGVDHVRVAARGNADKNECGIRYYGSSLYLLVNSNGKGGIEWRILELPDQTKLYSARPYEFLADLDTTLYFRNGVLRQSHEFADSTVVPRAAIAAVVEIAPALLRLLALDKRDRYAIPPVHLYKLVVQGDRIEFRGGPSSESIIVTLDPERKP